MAKFDFASTLGARVVHVMTRGTPQACPSCGVLSTSVKGWVSTGPRDVPFSVAARLVWRKRRWRCRVSGCARSSFTESVPQIPSRKRVTSRLRGRRLREAAGRAVAEGARTVAQAARDFGLSWPVVHSAFLDHAAAMLPEEPEPVTALGIDETTLRAQHRDRVFEEIVDRWHTGFIDLTGNQGLLGQRSKAAPAAMPGPGWPREPKTGATVSRPSRSTCARPTGPPCGSIRGVSEKMHQLGCKYPTTGGGLRMILS